MGDASSGGVWIGAISGGLAGAVVTLCTQRVLEAARIWRLSRALSVTPETIPDACRVRVSNLGVQTIEDAIAYISLTYDPHADILDGPAFIGPSHRVELRDDRLCWAIAAPDPNPFRINIYPGEHQALDIVRMGHDRIEIPSEQGWGDLNVGRKSRVFLARKRYEGTMYFVARNTLRRSFGLVIDPNAANLVTLTPRPFVGFLTMLFRGRLPGSDIPR
jgi:hypothetical protein